MGVECVFRTAGGDIRCRSAADKDGKVVEHVDASGSGSICLLVSPDTGTVDFIYQVFQPFHYIAVLGPSSRTLTVTDHVESAVSSLQCSTIQ
jgi:hypothetical protein